MTDNSAIFAPWDDPAARPLVSIRGLVKRFGEFCAIDDIDLDIFPREFFALLGPSGCGKTTLMRMLAGFEAPNSGSITLNDQDIIAVPAHRRPVNMMFQSYALFPHMTVAENIAFGLRQGPGKTRPSRGAIEARIEEMLILVQLSPFAKRKPHQLSGGQKQRVALARTLAKKPQLVLLDEPLGALDKKLRQETQFELMDIQEKLGMTFVIVTHDQEEAMTVSSRIAVMNQGRIAQVDTPNRIYETPGSVYVADFLGDVNLIAGHAESASKQPGEHSGKQLYRLHWAEGHSPLLLKSPAIEQRGASMFAATLALRPEKVNIAHDEPEDDTEICKLSGEVIDIAYTGSLSIYHVKIANGTIIKAQESNNRRLSMRRFGWEDKVWISWRRGAGTLLSQ